MPTPQGLFLLLHPIDEVGQLRMGPQQFEAVIVSPQFFLFGDETVNCVVTIVT